MSDSMASFIRTIQKKETEEYVDEILDRFDHYIPLKFNPTRAGPGDFIYLAHRGNIVGRAVISSIDEANSEVTIGADEIPFDARYLIRYKGTWQRSPQDIPFRGRQGIRYIDKLDKEVLHLRNLDSEFSKLLKTKKPSFEGKDFKRILKRSHESSRNKFFQGIATFTVLGILVVFMGGAVFIVKPPIWLRIVCFLIAGAIVGVIYKKK
jgi:hypothetical protein